MFIEGVTEDSVSDAQIAAFTMAVFLNDMTESETTALTSAMAHSGEVLRWSTKPIVDKHSTGGIGDSTSLLLSPWLAALGLKNPMISGRGLGHTGGTLDKLESIEGFQTDYSSEAFQAQVEEIGAAIVAQNQELAPADKRIYAVRDVTATVSSLPLITASILSKKLAAGLTHLILDVKCGNGAFMKTKAEARALANRLCEVGNAANCETQALITDMNLPLLNAAGNALEVKRVIKVMHRPEIEPYFFHLTERLVASLVAMTEEISEAEALAHTRKVWASGDVHQAFLALVKAQGGPDGFDEILASLPKSQYEIPIPAAQSGFVAGYDLEAIGHAVIELGGGRKTPGAPIDHSVGIAALVNYGDYVEKGAPLGIVHANDKGRGDVVAKSLAKHGFEIHQEQPAPYDFMIETINLSR